MTTLDVSAQFGGRDAAQAVLPHFRALKSALKGRSLDGFPFAQIAFILRVDGEVSAYGQSGPGNVHFDEKCGYVSVDIGITRHELGLGQASALATFVAEAIVASVSLLRGLGDSRLKAVDWRELEAFLRAFSAAYQAQFVNVQ